MLMITTIPMTKTMTMETTTKPQEVEQSPAIGIISFFYLGS